MPSGPEEQRTPFQRNVSKKRELIDYLICLSVGREILREFRDKVLVGAQKTKQVKIKTESCRSK